VTVQLLGVSEVLFKFLVILLLKINIADCKIGWILTQELSPAPLVVPRIEVREVCACVHLLPYKLPLFIKRAGLVVDARGAERVVVNRLDQRAAPISHSVCSA